MPTFEYRARDRVGDAVTGVLDAPGVDAVRSRLGEMGYIPVSVTEGKGNSRSSDKGESKGVNLNITIFKPKVRAKDLIVFNRQLATLFAAGIPLLRALQALAEQMENPTFKEVLLGVTKDIQEGLAFSEALAKHPSVFSGLFIAMIKAGEASGTLDSILMRLSDLAEHDAATKAKIKAATRYPKIVIGVMVLAICILMNFVVPNFVQIFEQVKLELPLATRILMVASNIFTNYWYILFVGAGGLYFAFRQYGKTKSGRYQIDKLSLKFPIFGPIFLKISMSIFTRTMSTLNRSGLSIIKNLEICSEVVENDVIAKLINELKESVKQGESISLTMKRSKYFTPMVIQMMSAGEESGELDNMLVKVSEYYDMEVDHSISNISSLIEPLLLIFLGGVVLFLMLAIFMPMWNMTKLAQQ